MPPFTQSAASLWASDSPLSCQTPSRPLEDSLLVISHPHLASYTLQQALQPGPFNLWSQHPQSGLTSPNINLPACTASGSRTQVHSHQQPPRGTCHSLQHHSLNRGSWGQEVSHPMIGIPRGTWHSVAGDSLLCAAGTVKTLTSISSLNP